MRLIYGASSIGAIAMFVTLTSTPIQLRAADAACALYGAVYEPKPEPHDHDPLVVYKLTVQHLPDSSPDAAFADAWVFQMFDAKSAHLMTTFSMEEVCPNGAGLCRLGASGHPAAVSSDVVALTEKFSTAVKTGQAPYAIILPGFAGANWTFTQASPDARTMRFSTSPPAYPDLREAIAWVRVSCGHDEQGAAHEIGKQGVNDQKANH
jgi:hypothetical protein